MPYATNKDLPETVRERLPKHGQDIYRASFNSAWEEYRDRPDHEGTAHAVAWSAVKDVYHKDERSEWVLNSDE